MGSFSSEANGRPPILRLFNMLSACFPKHKVVSGTRPWMGINRAKLASRSDEQGGGFNMLQELKAAWKSFQDNLDTEGAGSVMQNLRFGGSKPAGGGP